MTTLTSDDALKILPKADLNFTAIKGHGKSAHNLEYKLELATLHSSSALHPIKDHIKAIARVFGNPFVQHMIKMRGGLGPSESKIVYRRLLKEISKQDPGILNNNLKKNVLHRIMKHYSFEKQETPHASLPNQANTARADLVAERPRRFDRNENQQKNKGNTSIFHREEAKENKSLDDSHLNVSHLAGHKPEAPKSTGFMLE